LAVENKLFTLSEYVRMIKDKKDLSAQAIADRANKVCKPLKEFKAQYVNDLINNEFGQPTIAKLQELAAGLGVPEEEIFLVARGLPISPENAPYNKPEAKLLRWWRRLTETQQETVIDVIRALVGKNLKGSSSLTDQDIEKYINEEGEP
jgi:transcriptional regulator with XRE-family HTH domain